MKKIKTIHIVLFFLIILSCDKKETIKKTFQPNEKFGKDVVLSEGYPKRNYSTQDQLWLFNTTINDSIDNDRRFLLRIGFSTLPESAKVDSAFIYLHSAGKGHFGVNNSFVIERVVNVWVKKEVNWNNHPKTDSDTAIEIGAPTHKTQNFKIDVTDFVKGVLNKDYFNNGLLFKLNNEDGPNRGLRFHSSSSLEKEKRPKLVVYYKK